MARLAEEVSSKVLVPLLLMAEPVGDDACETVVAETLDIAGGLADTRDEDIVDSSSSPN